MNLPYFIFKQQKTSLCEGSPSEFSKILKFYLFFTKLKPTSFTGKP